MAEEGQRPREWAITRIKRVVPRKCLYAYTFAKLPRHEARFPAAYPAAADPTVAPRARIVQRTGKLTRAHAYAPANCDHRRASPGRQRHITLRKSCRDERWVGEKRLRWAGTAQGRHLRRERTAARCCLGNRSCSTRNACMRNGGTESESCTDEMGRERTAHVARKKTNDLHHEFEHNPLPAQRAPSSSASRPMGGG